MLMAKTHRTAFLICLVGALAPGKLCADVSIERIAAWGGEVYAIAVQGDLAAMSSGERVLIVDISNPDRPRQLGAISLGARVRGVAVRRDHVYASTWTCADYDLAVIDVSDPTTPQVVGSNGTRCQPFIGVLAEGELVFVGELSGLRILDVTDPRNPHQIGRTSGCVVPGCWDGVDDMVLSDSLLYVGDSNYFRILDVSDPTDPVALSSVEVDFAGRGGVAVEGERAYVSPSSGSSPKESWYS